MLFPLVLDTTAIYQEWERLVVVYAVRKVNVHDAKLVAAMLVHGLTHILTFNTSDLDLTLVALMLSQGKTPDLFHLQEQQYNQMADEFLHEICLKV